MVRHAHYKPSLDIVSALCLAFLPGIVHAQVMVTPTVTQLANGVYHYDYTISNNTNNDLFDVTIHVLPGVATALNVMAPIGFKGFYTDSVLGLVDYTEDSAFFTATPLSGFTYDSFIAPHASIYDANQFDFGAGNIVTTTSTTLAAVPEPGSQALLGFLGTATCFALRKRWQVKTG